MLVARRPKGRELLTIQRSCHDKAAGAEQRTDVIGRLVTNT